MSLLESLRRPEPPRSRARLPRRRALVAALGALIIVMTITLVPATSAAAHAVLVRSSPVDGTTLQHSPAAVELTFDERIRLVPGSARVISASGTRADAGRARVDAAASQVTIPLQPDLAKGGYIVTWRVVSADTHIVAGSITFGIRAPAATTTNTAAPTSALDVVAATAQGVSYVGVVLLVGVGVVGLMLWPSTLRAPRSRRLRVAGVATLIAAAAVEFLLQGPRAADSGWSGVLGLDGLGSTAASAFGAGLLVRIAVLAVAAPLLVGDLGTSHRAPGRLPSPSRVAAARLVAGLAAIAVLVTIALDGHAGAGAGDWLAVPAAVLHLAAMAVWLGGIVVLGVVLLPRLGAAGTERSHGLLIAGMRSWSTVAFVAIAVLIVTGEYQAWRTIRPLPALWGTGYGDALLVKVAFVGAAVAIAAVPQRLLLRTGRSPAAARLPLRTLRRSVRIEACCTAAVVAATAVLTALPPATTTYGPSFTAGVPIGPDRLVVHLAGTHHGPTTMTVQPETGAGAPLPVRSLDATLASPENHIAAIAVPLRRNADGTWRSTAMTIPLSGTWTITFDVSVNSATGYAAATEFTAW